MTLHRRVRTGLFAVLLACLAGPAAACGSSTTHSGGITDYNPLPCGTTHKPLAASDPLWSPAGAGAAVQAVIKPGAVVHLRVGQRVRFRELSGLSTTPMPGDLRHLTWYGDTRTFLAFTPGTVAMTVANYNDPSCCRKGPCAHLNAAIPMTVHIAADSHATAPQIPSSVLVDRVAPQQLYLTVGEAVELTGDLELRGSGGLDSLLATGPHNTYVATRPGHATFDLDNNYGQSTATLTVTVAAHQAPDPRTLVTSNDAAGYLPRIGAVRLLPPATGVSSQPSYAVCIYWAGDGPGPTTASLQVGTAYVGRRTATQLDAEMKQDGYREITADPRVGTPAYLTTSSLRGFPQLQIYAIKDGVEITVGLNAPNATRADVEHLAELALSRL